MIEPVHCGSNSILKVRFLVHPVYKEKKPAKTEWLFLEDYATLILWTRAGVGAAVLLPMKAAHVDGSPGRLFLIPPSSEF